ncbi:carboxypeptidase regulatory-like domain-containing protein [Sphingomonas sp.]|jgi:plastocyanin|uniref:carboxypeptidase regulatory-like domain-containing protein n=1 Tax=Sphingomonas sp. TaxID=28214 RepID=UPI002E35DC56|nr:carboxypeptidase regulatory-like domain-containing protein [Sphingomonas sp.]HEX4695964.1 carboxypeptidase regulatory-like domain-containing protein [Sphingomonas sp.]
MRIVVCLSVLLLLGMAPPPPLAGVSVAVRGANGQPVVNAVVSIRLVGRDTPGPRMGSGYAVRQQNIQFAPFLSVVPIDADVAFPNLDSVRHQVYSFSPAKRFELKLYAREQNRTVRFDRAGAVSLGCNIHDQMTAFIYVTDSVFTARTDAAGNVNLAGVPAGPISITVWHPYLRAPGNQVSRQIDLGGGARETFTAALRPPPPSAGSSY